MRNNMNLTKMMITFVVLSALWLPLPTAAHPSASGQAQAPVACEDEYTVQAGDWLSKIAEKYYGDLLAYPVIVLVNNADTGDNYTDIVNPDLIEPGWILCIPSGEDMAKLMTSSAGTAPAGLAAADLGNATYRGIYEEPVTLTNGQYEGEPFVPGGASRPTVTLIETPLGYGDVSGDGQTDAVVLLAENSGGSGTFVYLAAVVNQNGQPLNVGTTLLGDRVQVDSITINNKQIMIELVQAGPDDPMCCPSQRVIKTFELQGDQLVEISSEMAESVGGGELTGTVWQWEQTQMNKNTQFVPDKPSNYTIEFLPEGQVTVKADCNSANGTYTMDGSSLTIEVMAMTLAACPPGSSSDEFVKQLNNAAIFFIQEGSLFIDLKLDSGTMQLSPMKSVGLVGIPWLVRGYNNGRGGVVSVIIGTEMTAVFGEDGQLTGSAGCNNYSAGYKTDGKSIAIGLPIVTLMECAEPEGIMVQEMEYLAALQTAATHKVESERLEMRTSEGSLVADFVTAVTGQVTYLPKIALPDDAIMQVQLQDTSLADAPAMVVGEYVLATLGRQVPLPFEVTYNTAEIDPGHTYSLGVRISDGQGKLLFINTQAFNVLTRGNPIFGVEVMVEAVQ